MSDDRLRDLFNQVAVMNVDVPTAERAIDRGRRHRRDRLRAAGLAWTVMLAVGLGAPPAAVSLAGSTGGSPEFSAVRFQGAHAPSGYVKAVHSSGSRQAMGATTIESPPSNATASANSSNDTGGPSLPPQGSGHLVLAVDAADRLVMTRIGMMTSPVPVPGIEPAAGTPPILVSDPAGGWVVVISSPDRWPRVRGTRLALVAATGRSDPFGPVFLAQTVTSAAVDPSGSRVAIALSKPMARPRIAVLPLPRHRGSARSWRLRSARGTLVTSLSWAPDGRRLSYLPARRPAASTRASSPLTLDVARHGSALPLSSGSPPAVLARAGCVLDATAWLGTSGSFGALEHCARGRAELLKRTGTGSVSRAGRAVTLALPSRRRYCGTPALDPNANGTGVLISYCGIYLDQRGTLTRLPGGLKAAAFSG
jgi:hypothetical protein